MPSWFARCAADRRAHDQVWGPERVLEADGLSRFQHRVEAALRDAGYEIASREAAPVRGGEPGDLYLTGLVGTAAARVYVYQDGLELEADGRTLRLEDSDVRHPDEMLHALLGRLGELREAAG
jgi:hypothetical protein